jgi:hypothetical protein
MVAIAPKIQVPSTLTIRVFWYPESTLFCFIYRIRLVSLLLLLGG